VTVSIQEIKRNLNLTGECDDVLLQTLLDGATAAIGVIVDPMPEDGTPDIELAVIQLVTHWYENRDGVRPIPEGVRELLMPYRQWVF
jgi:hypothetical protein